MKIAKYERVKKHERRLQKTAEQCISNLAETVDCFIGGWVWKGLVDVARRRQELHEHLKNVVVRYPKTCPRRKKKGDESWV
jgi:hypothetical protein